MTITDTETPATTREYIPGSRIYRGGMVRAKASGQVGIVQGWSTAQCTDGSTEIIVGVRCPTASGESVVTAYLECWEPLTIIGVLDSEVTTRTLVLPFALEGEVSLYDETLSDRDIIGLLGAMDAAAQVAERWRSRYQLWHQGNRVYASARRGRTLAVGMFGDREVLELRRVAVAGA